MRITLEGQHNTTQHSVRASAALDGRRLEAVRAAASGQSLPEELRLIVAAGGDPASLAQLTKPAASDQLKRLGFTNQPLRTKLLATLFRDSSETGGHLRVPPAGGQPTGAAAAPPLRPATSTIVLKHKVQNGARELRLATAPARADLQFARDGVAFVALPPALMPRLTALRVLAHADEAAVDLEAFGTARAALEAWLNAWLPSASQVAVAHGDESQQQPPHAYHYLRHCIVRDTHPAEGAARRKTMPLQRPGKAFHIDSDHTDLVNIWLPLGDDPLSDHQLGFLSDSEGADELLGTVGLKRLFARNDFATFERRASIVHRPGLRWGDAVVFRSGGSRAVVHGSFRLDGDHRTDAPRRSVEFRCQPRDDGLGFTPVGAGAAAAGAAEVEPVVDVIAGTELT